MPAKQALFHSASPQTFKQYGPISHNYALFSLFSLLELQAVFTGVFVKK